MLIGTEIHMRDEAYADEIEIGPARAEDAAEIIAMVRSERLNPTGLDWPNFLVARQAGAIVGAAQLRPHRGARELGSLVVRPDHRHRGMGARLVEARLARARGERLVVITTAAAAPRYARWGFRPLAPFRAPASVVLSYAMGRAVSLYSMLRGLPPRRLVLLERPAGG